MFYAAANGYALCLTCADGDMGKFAIGELEMKMVENLLPCIVCELGSMLDWIPLIKDDKAEHLVLMCLNKENKWYGKLAFGCFDDHGRYGIFISPRDTLEAIIEECAGMKADDAGAYVVDDDELRSRIAVLMVRRNMSVYYG
jgi:hypothetical protein